jgi:hypothetical protein
MSGFGHQLNILSVAILPQHPHRTFEQQSEEIESHRAARNFRPPPLFATRQLDGSTHD